MKKAIFIFLIFSSLLSAKDSLNQIDAQAKVLWEARDFSAATKMYESLLLSVTTKWQRARILYNLGTIQLSQNQPSEALRYFQQIQAEDLLLQSYGKNFVFNLGIAYYQSALYFAQSSIPFIEEALIFLKQSSKFMDLAQKLSCEQEECMADPFIAQWQKKIEFQREILEKTITDPITKKNDKDPLHISLKNILSQAHHALQSFLLLLMEDSHKEETRKNVVYEQQKVIDLSSLFIPAVIKSQQEAMQSKDCGLFPWEQIIPLFDQGLQFAKGALQDMQQQNWDFERIQAQQIFSIQDWTRVLQLLENAPTEAEKKSIPSTDFINQVHGLQEMFLEDEKRISDKTKDLHSW